MSYWTTWGIVGSSETPEKYAEVMAVTGVTHNPKRGIPIFNGTLNDFSLHFASPFTVYKSGRYLKVGEGRDV